MKHTKEPWPYFIDIATQMHPINDVQAAIISPEDYIRARICVHACAGLTNEQLESGYIQKLIQENKDNKKLIFDINNSLLQIKEDFKKQAG